MVLKSARALITHSSSRPQLAWFPERRCFLQPSGRVRGCVVVRGVKKDRKPPAAPSLRPHAVHASRTAVRLSVAPTPASTRPDECDATLNPRGHRSSVHRAHRRHFEALLPLLWLRSGAVCVPSFVQPWPRAFRRTDTVQVNCAVNVRIGYSRRTRQHWREEAGLETYPTEIRFARRGCTRARQSGASRGRAPHRRALQAGVVTAVGTEGDSRWPDDPRRRYVSCYALVSSAAIASPKRPDAFAVATTSTMDCAAMR